MSVQEFTGSEYQNYIDSLPPVTTHEVNRDCGTMRIPKNPAQLESNLFTRTRAHAVKIIEIYSGYAYGSITVDGRENPYTWYASRHGGKWVLMAMPHTIHYNDVFYHRHVQTG